MYYLCVHGDILFSKPTSILYSVQVSHEICSKQIDDLLQIYQIKLNSVEKFALPDTQASILISIQHPGLTQSFHPLRQPGPSLVGGDTFTPNVKNDFSGEIILIYRVLWFRIR